jgi:hypothetical protein
MNDDTLTQKRWKTAIHEAGHLVIGLLLAADPTERCFAVLKSDGDGEASMPISTNSDDQICATACGPVAQDMLRVSPCPRPPEPSPLVEVPRLPVFPDEKSQGRTTAPPEPTPDAVRIARNCIEGFERHPWLWLRNYQTLMDEAHRRVFENASLILSVAARI